MLTKEKTALNSNLTLFRLESLSLVLPMTSGLEVLSKVMKAVVITAMVLSAMDMTNPGIPRKLTAPMPATTRSSEIPNQVRVKLASVSHHKL